MVQATSENVATGGAVNDLPAFTKEELREFDALTMLLSSRSQMDRIGARLELNAYIKKHGKAKCDAMFAKLTEKERGTKDR